MLYFFYIFFYRQQFNPDVNIRLTQSLSNINIYLAIDGIGRAQKDNSKTNELTIYILIGGVGLLAVVLIVLATTCYFNNRR
jgi:hypothetical protein